MRFPFQEKFQTLFKKRKRTVSDWKKKYIESQLKLETSETDRRALYDQVQNWKKMTSTGFGVMESIMEDGIKWFDPSSLGSEGERRYRLDAKVVLENRTFKNEVQKLEADIISYLALKTKDFPEVRDMRMQLSGIKLIRERLEELQKFLE